MLKKLFLSVLILICTVAFMAWVLDITQNPIQEQSSTSECITKEQAPQTVIAPAAKQTPKVFGNKDSRRYHLPGMKFYNAVKSHHRVEFDSEADAMKAGYHKAPR